VRAFFVHSPQLPIGGKRPEIAGAPPIITRADWHADEAIRRAPPYYADGIHLAIVHHTAGSNSYSKAQSASIVRSIELYHVQGNGWNDIGYNFLVDKYGQVFEGRYGGITRPVIGAHAQGFNSGSVGVAVIGDYGSTSISPRRACCARLPDRLAARPRARRSAFTGRAGLRRQPALPGRHRGDAERDLRASGRVPDELSGRESLRPAAGDPGRGRADGTAEALRAGRGGDARRAGALSPRASRARRRGR
jgi:hypothetical protein